MLRDWNTTTRFLSLPRSGLVRTFLSERECGDVAGNVIPDCGTGVIISTKERRKVLGRIGGRWTA